MFDIGCSTGIALLPEDGATSSTLLQNADAAMYAAKKARSNYEFYIAEIGTECWTRGWPSIAELRRAIEARQFELHYQPKVTWPAAR